MSLAAFQPAQHIKSLFGARIVLRGNAEGGQSLFQVEARPVMVEDIAFQRLDIAENVG